MSESNAPSGGSSNAAQRRAMRIYGAATLLFVLAIGYLAWNGYDRSLAQSGGVDVFSGITDPTQPGYEAAVRPTPAYLLAVLDSQSKLASVAVVSTPPGDVPSTILVVALESISEIEGSAPVALSLAYEQGGLDALTKAAETALGFGFADEFQLSSSGFAEMLPPTISLLNPDTIYRPTADGQREIVYSAGPIQVSAEAAADFLSLQSEGESAYNRFNRDAVFWSAIAKTVSGDVAASGGAAGSEGSTGASGTGDAPDQTATSLPGPNSSGGVNIGLVPGGATATSAPLAVGESGESGESGPVGAAPTGVSEDSGSKNGSTSEEDDSAAQEALASALDGELRSEAVPLTEIPLPTPTGESVSIYRIDKAALNQALPAMIPFPRSAVSGQRIGVKLLNGTTTEGTELLVAGSVVAAGGEVKVVGNGSRMDLAKSTVIYGAEEGAALAKEVAAELGVEATLGPVEGADVLVVVTVGSDQK